MTKTLVERLLEWPAMPTGDALSSEVVGSLMISAASRIEELERALKPFAEAGATLSSRWEDHETHWQGALSYQISAGQLRAARSALSDKG